MNYTEIGKYGIARVLKDLPIKDFNVGVASAISSYSRCRLWSLIDGIESKGKRVFMCDTDSVITDAKLNDYPDLMEAFMWDGCGDALGSLKNEAETFNEHIFVRDIVHMLGALSTQLHCVWRVQVTQAIRIPFLHVAVNYLIQHSLVAGKFQAPFHVMMKKQVHFLHNALHEGFHDC